MRARSQMHRALEMVLDPYQPPPFARVLKRRGFGSVRRVAQASESCGVVARVVQ